MSNLSDFWGSLIQNMTLSNRYINYLIIIWIWVNDIIKWLINASCVRGQPSLWTLRMLDWTLCGNVLKIRETCIVFTIHVLLLYGLCIISIAQRLNWSKILGETHCSAFKIPKLQCNNGACLQNPDDLQKLKTPVGLVGLTDSKMCFLHLTLRNKSSSTVSI